MIASPSILKNPKGWFAAGAEVGQALMILSDGAFKLFVYLCLNARRDQGIIHATQTDLAKNLKKSHGTIRKCLREMEAAGICRCHFGHSPSVQGMVEITESYWPYKRDEIHATTDDVDNFVSGVRKMLEERACIRPSFSIADEVLAKQWHSRGFPLEKIQQAVLLGCARKYSSWHNNQNQLPICSLKYFEPILEEIEQQKIAADYWDYLSSRLQRIEKLWTQNHKIKTPSDESQLYGEISVDGSEALQLDAGMF